MKMLTFAGAHACGKTSVIIKTAAILNETGLKTGVMKLDCIFSDDDSLYRAAGITNIKMISGNVCPDHFFAVSVPQVFEWGLENRLDVLITESAGLCGRCAPHIRDIPAVCVIDCLAGISAPAKTGPMLRYADHIIITKADLARPAYRDLVCLIGSGGLPDPMLPIYMYHRHGREGVKALCRNIRTVAGPSSTIRYIGKEQNPYGAIFVMPALFAEICRGKQNVRVILPESGALAEPVIYMKKAGEENTTSRIEAFLFSGRGMQTASSRMMTPADGHGGAIPIDRFCRTHLLYPELETVAAMLKMYLADKG